MKTKFLLTLVLLTALAVPGRTVLADPLRDAVAAGVIGGLLGGLLGPPPPAPPVCSARRNVKLNLLPVPTRLSTQIRPP